MTQRVAPSRSAGRSPADHERPLSPTHRFSPALLRMLDGTWVDLSPDLARQLAQKSTAALAETVRARRRQTLARAEAAAYRRAERELLLEEREAERRNRALWRRVKVKTPKSAAFARKPHKPTRGGFPANSSALASYSGAIVDRLGRRGVFLRIRYCGRKTTRPGVCRRAAIYICEGAVERDDGSLCLISNVAETAQEAVAAMELLEQVNREVSSDAKLLFHLIANLPHQLTVEQMMEEARRFAEAQFGCRDLPYVVALHPPSPAGDQRNWHLHILTSTRPMRRVGDYEWELGQQLRTEVDNPEQFRRMRELYAEIQTVIAHEAGLDLTFTALSNVSRGLPMRPQEHLGGVLTDLVRRDEPVAANERNHATVLEGEQALLDEQLRHKQEAAVAQAALIGRVLARFAQPACRSPFTSAPERSGPIEGIAARDVRGPRPAYKRRTSDRLLPLAVHASAALSKLKPMRVPLPASMSVVATGSGIREMAIAAVASRPLVPVAAAESWSAAADPIRSRVPMSGASFKAMAPPSQSTLTWSSDIASPTSMSPIPLAASTIAVAVVAADPLKQSSAPTSTLLPPLPTLADALNGPALAPSRPRVSGVVAHSRIPLSSAPMKPNVSASPSITAPLRASTVDFDPVLSPSVRPSTAVLGRIEHTASAPAGTTWPVADLTALTMLIARRSADVTRRKAERERRAAAAAATRRAAADLAAREAAARQAAAELEEQQADLRALQALDPFVQEFGHRGLWIGADVLITLRRDHDWQASASVQRVLAAMLDDQNERIERLDSAPDGTPPVAIVDGRIVPADHLAPDLKRSVERWSADESFRAFVAHCWPPAPPPIATEEPALRSELLSEEQRGTSGSAQATAAAVTIDLDGAWRWAAARRERLMNESDTVERHDDADTAPPPGITLVRPGQPMRSVGAPAARVHPPLVFDRGRGG